MVDGSTQSGGFQWRYAFIGLCFVALAAFRLEDGSALWAAVFGLVALANAYLWARFVLPPGLGGVRLPEAGRPDSAPSQPTPAQMRRALEVYETRARGWFMISIAGWITTAGVIVLSPPLALIGAALSLFSTYRFRRCRRSVGTLRRALATAPGDAAR